MTIEEICNKFGVELSASKAIDKGLINNSYLVLSKNGEKLMLQRVNSNVFKNVPEVMNNIYSVTQHIRKKAIERGDDPNRATINLRTTSSETPYVSFVDENGKTQYFRMYDYIDNASTYDNADDNLLYEAGVGFGKFQKDLADFPAETLSESIKDFHNTQSRFEHFLNLIKKLELEKRYAELNEVYPEIEIAKQYGYQYADVITRALRQGDIPRRVVHNDTKLNNVMLDNDTNKAVCVIDLDTIMPGSMLFDYGDAIRYCANTGAEDDTDLSNVSLDLNKFKAFTQGYLSQVAESITPAELDLMSVSPIILAYELALRFLTDHLEGNKYFKCTRENHNLDRARAQFALMLDMIEKHPQMTQCINDTYNNTLENI